MKIWDIAFIACISIVCIIGTVAYHETAHIQINKMYGCYNQQIEINYYSVGVKFYPSCFPDERSYHAAQALHSYNEIIGYNTSVIGVILSLLLGYIMVLTTKGGSKYE